MPYLQKRRQLGIAPIREIEPSMGKTGSSCILQISPFLKDGRMIGVDTRTSREMVRPSSHRPYGPVILAAVRFR